MVAKYFGGFGLKNEQALFENLEALDMQSGYDVVGFSKGAQEALEYALNTSCRIRRLSLISPVFFQDKTEREKSRIVESFDNNPLCFFRVFLKKALRCSGLSYQDFPLPHFLTKDLQSVLFYEFSPHKFKVLEQKNISIEVFVGEKDTLLNVPFMLEYFSPLVDRLFLFRNQGHFVR